MKNWNWERTHWMTAVAVVLFGTVFGQAETSGAKNSAIAKMDAHTGPGQSNLLIERIISEAQIHVEVRPRANVLFYTIEERIPVGVNPSSISDGGVFNGALRTIKWGPFLDAQPRSLSYAYEIGADVSGELKWTGFGSFNGVAQDIGGEDTFVIETKDEPNEIPTEVDFLPPAEYVPATYVSGVISLSTEPTERNVIVSWPASPSRRYQVEVAESVIGIWKNVTDGTVASVEDVGTFEMLVDSEKSQFFRIRELDHTEPELRLIFPSQADIGIDRFESLRLLVLDENDINPNSIELGLPTGEQIDLSDSRLAYTDGELTYTPARDTPLGPEGEEVSFSVSVADRFGNGLREFDWTFALELPVIVAKNAQGIGQPIPQPLVRMNLSETTTIVEATPDRVVIQYTGEAPAFESGQLLWSNDPQYPYYWRIVSMALNATAKIVTIDAQPARLDDIIVQGSFNNARVIEIDPLTNAPLVQAADFGFSIGSEFQYGDQVTQVIVNDPKVTLSASIDWTHQGAVRVAGSIRDSELKKLRIRSPQLIEVTASSTFWTGDAVSVEDLVGKKIPTRWKLFERGREFVTFIGAVPVWLELTFTIEGGYSFEINTAASITKGATLFLEDEWLLSFDHSETPQWTMSDTNPRVGMEALQPEFEMNGGAEAEVYLKAAIQALLYSTAGVEASLVPSVGVNGEFTFSSGPDPLAYEWEVYGRLKSEIKPVLEFWQDEWGKLPSWVLFDGKRRLLGDKFPKKPLAFESVPGEHRVREGLDLELAVVTNDPNNPAVTYEWSRDGRTLPATNNVLALGDVSPVHEGVYTISVSRGEERISTSFQLTVSDGGEPLEFVTFPEDISTEEGSSVNLIVLTNDPFNPEVTYEWTRDGSLLGTSGRVLGLEDLSAEDDGVYSVAAIRGRERISTTFQLSVNTPLEPLKFDEILEDLTIDEGDEVRFIAVVNDLSNPEVSYEWKHDGRFLDTEARVLVLEEASPDDGGLYSVTARRGDERISMSFRLIVQREAIELALDMVLIPAGSFTIGSAESEEGHWINEAPQTHVTISKPFWLGVTEVTQAQWRRVMGRRSFEWEGSNLPADSIDWNEATIYCRTLTERERNAGRLPEGYIYALPTEAQWEYACRAGTGSRYWFGNSESELGDYAWYSENSEGRTHPVGTKLPNPWGLYDMEGNLVEWVSTLFDTYPGGSVVDSVGSGTSNGNRVYRGGSWKAHHERCRSATRGSTHARRDNEYIGFRAALVPAPSE